MSRRQFPWEQNLYGLMTVAFVGAVSLFVYLGHFNRYMADDYCLVAALRSDGFLKTQTVNYFLLGGRFSYAAVISAVELLGPITASIGPPISLTCWLVASVWALYQLASINRCRHSFLVACLGATLIVFAMLNAADNVVQSAYWESGHLLYLLPLVLLTVHVGLVGFAVRKNLRGWPAVVFILLAAFTTLIVGGFNEPYTFAQTSGHLLALIVCYFAPADSARRRALRYVVAGLVGSLIAVSIMIAAPGNAVRRSYLTPPSGVLAVIGLTLLHSCSFIIKKMVQAPLTTLLLCLIPAHAAIGYYNSLHGRENVQGTRWRWIVALPVTGFLMTLVCFLPGVYGSGDLVARARLIPQFVFVCTAVGSAFFVGLEIASRYAVRPQILRRASLVTLALSVVIALVAASLTTLRLGKLIPGARESAALWDQTDREIRAARAQGVMDQTVPAFNDIETRLGAPRTDLHLERDPLNWKNRCVAEFYGLNSIRAR